MSLMANKQECHLEYCCGNKYKQIQQKWSYDPTIFYLASQRSSRVNIVEGKNNVKSFFWCCLRLPFLDKNCFTIKSPSKNEDVLNTKKKKTQPGNERYKCSFNLRRESLHNLHYLYLKREEPRYSWVIGFSFFIKHSLSVFLSI